MLITTPTIAADQAAQTPDVRPRQIAEPRPGTGTVLYAFVSEQLVCWLQLATRRAASGRLHPRLYIAQVAAACEELQRVTDTAELADLGRRLLQRQEALARDLDPIPGPTQPQNTQDEAWARFLVLTQAAGVIFE